MPIMMLMEWQGVTPAQYEAVRKEVHFELDVPPGGVFHVAAHDPATNTLRVTDVWDKAEDFNKFAETRLIPTTIRLGIHGQPKVQILPTLNVFAPGYDKKA